MNKTDLSVTYAGLTLKSPVIVSSSGLTSSVERIKKIANAGAGAVVLKSLFEEQIQYEVGELIGGADYPEALDYINTYARDNSVQQYLKLISDSKKAVDIPVMASINCHSASEWTDFAFEIEEAGADAVELNIYYPGINPEKDPREYEKVYLDIVDEVQKKVKIPVVIKLGSHFTNLAWFVHQLQIRKVAAVVLFNRFYAPDIDPETMTMGAAEVLSTPAEIRNSLRWVGIISSKIDKIDIAASTGVHSGLGVIKQLLAGAEAVQICSVLYRNGVDYTKNIVNEVKNWMEKKQYWNIEEFRGKMNYSNLADPETYERAQFIKYFSKMH